MTSPRSETNRPASIMNRWPTGSGLPVAAAANRVSNASASRCTTVPRTARSNSRLDRTHGLAEPGFAGRDEHEAIVLRRVLDRVDRGH